MMEYSELIYILSPIILVFTSLFVLMIDFFTSRKSIILFSALTGLVISAMVSILQFISFEANQSIFFDTLVFDKFYLFSAISLILITSAILLAFYDYIVNQISFRSEFISLLLLSLVGSNLDNK